MKYSENIMVDVNGEMTDEAIKAVVTDVNKALVLAYYKEISDSETPYALIRENPLIMQVSTKRDGEVIAVNQKLTKYALPSMFRAFCQENSIDFTKEPRAKWGTLYTSVVAYFTDLVKASEKKPSDNSVFNCACALVNSMYGENGLSLKRNDVRVMLSIILQAAKKDGKFSLKKIAPEKVEQAFMVACVMNGVYNITSKSLSTEKSETPANANETANENAAETPVNDEKQTA